MTDTPARIGGHAARMAGEVKETICLSQFYLSECSILLDVVQEWTRITHCGDYPIIGAHEISELVPLRTASSREIETSYVVLFHGEEFILFDVKVVVL